MVLPSETTTSPSPKPTLQSVPGALAEFQRYQPRPGHPDWPRLADEARALARELGPGLERPQQGWQRWARRLQAHRTALGNYWINRQRHRSGREDLLPLYFIWTLHRHCNFRCTYCDDHRGRKYPDLPKEGTLDTEQALRLLRVMRTRTPSVYFSGGEPLLREDLPLLTRTARDLGYFPIVVNTNGSVLHRQLQREAWRTWLADMDIVVVSVDRLDLTALKELWVYNRPENVFRNLLLLRELQGELGFKLAVNTVIHPGRINEARDVLDLANDLGIWFTGVPLNVGPRIHPDLPGDPDYRQFARTLLLRKRTGFPIIGSERFNERMLTSAPLRCRNTLKPHIDFDGRLFWPCKSMVNVDPAMVQVLDHDHVDDLWAYAVSRVEPTRFHGPARNQCGGDCNWAQNYTTDAYAHGLEHPLSLAQEIFAFAGR